MMMIILLCVNNNNNSNNNIKCFTLKWQVCLFDGLDFCLIFVYAKMFIHDII